MFRFTAVASTLFVCAAFLTASPAAGADELRNVKSGEAVPAYKLPAIDGTPIDSESFKGSVVVLVYLSAEQRSSELAAADSKTVLADLKDDKVKLIHVTADVTSKAYFERLRKDKGIDVPLAFDADRTLYHQLGMIVFPTTIVVNKDNKLSHVISLRSPDYARVLDAYIRHAQGSINDAQLQEKLKATANAESSPKNLASAHRAAARLMREKGRLDAAKEELNKARELDPSDHEVQLDLADIDLASGDYDAAEKLIEEVLKAQPDHRRAKQLKGICLFDRNKLEDAEKILLEALPLNPDPSRVHYYLGRIYEKKGQGDKAMQHYREALRKLLNEPENGSPAAPAATK